MIDTIPDLPDNVLGFSAKGTVTAQDYESAIIPAGGGAISPLRSGPAPIPPRRRIFRI